MIASLYLSIIHVTTIQSFPYLKQIIEFWLVSSAVTCLDFPVIQTTYLLAFLEFSVFALLRHHFCHFLN